MSVGAAGPVDLAAAARAGIADCVEHLGGGSASFALPAWRKGAGLVADTRNAELHEAERSAVEALRHAV